LFSGWETFQTEKGGGVAQGTLKRKKKKEIQDESDSEVQCGSGDMKKEDRRASAKKTEATEKKGGARPYNQKNASVGAVGGDTPSMRSLGEKGVVR